MKIVVWTVIAIGYLVVGYVVNAVIDTLEDTDVEESFSCWLLWPFVLIGYMVIKIVLRIGRRVSVWPIVLTEILKISIEKNAEKRRRREVKRLMRELGYAEAEHDGKSGKGR